MPTTTAFRVPHGCLEDMHIAFLIVGTVVLLDILQNLSGVDDAPIIVAILLGALGRKEIQIGLAQQGGQGKSHGIAEALIGRNDPTFQVLAEHIQREAFDQRLVFRTRGTQRLLDALPVGDFSLEPPGIPQPGNQPLDPSPHGRTSPTPPTSIGHLLASQPDRSLSLPFVSIVFNLVTSV